MNLINELRELAEDLHVNGYNRYAAAMSKAADELAKWEAVFGHLGDTPDECGNAIIAARDELEERCATLTDALRADKATLQQMMYSLKDRLEVAEKERDWHAERCEDAMNECDALRAKIEQMERQEPVGVLHVGSYYGEELEDWEFEADQRVCDRLNEQHVTNPTSLKLYALPGAKGEENG